MLISLGIKLLEYTLGIAHMFIGLHFVKHQHDEHTEEQFISASEKKYTVLLQVCCAVSDLDT